MSTRETREGFRTEGQEIAALLERLRSLSRTQNIYLYFDDDGVIHKWNNIEVPVPADFIDRTEEDKSAYIKQKIYEVLTAPGYYMDLPTQGIIPLLMEFLHEINANVRVLSCSINRDTDLQKYYSIQKALPWIKRENIILLPDGQGQNKYQYIPEKDKESDGIYILIDDHTPNCFAFEKQGGIAIKCINDINGKGGNWQGAKLDAYGTLRECLTVLVEQIEQELERGLESNGYEYSEPDNL